MQRNHIIVLGSLGVLAGLAWYQRKSAGAQAESVTALGQQSNNNIAASILGSLAPVASSNSQKAQAASVVDSKPAGAPVSVPLPVFDVAPVTAAPVKLNEFNVWQTNAKPVNVNTGGGGFSMVGS